MTATDSVVYPPATREIGTRRELAPEIHQAFDAFSRQAGAAFAHSTVALHALAEEQPQPSDLERNAGGAVPVVRVQE